jgi:hypothetical protein
LLAGKPSHRCTPLDVADWLEGMAEGCERALTEARSARDWGRAEVQRIMTDVTILAGMARHFAEKFRAACWAELFVATKASALIEPMIDHARRAVLAWEGIAAVSRDVYHDDITYGPQSWLRGSWHERLPEMRAELLDLEAIRGLGGTESVATDAKTEAAIAALRARRPVQAEPIDIGGGRFAAGETVAVSIVAEADAAPVLHYRHINQAERWRSVVMERRGDRFGAEIPADYTASDFHLQYFVSFSRDGESVLVPGLADDLANEPYVTLLRH